MVVPFSSIVVGEDAAVTALGATFVTITFVVYSVWPPSLSMIRPFTMKVPLS